MRIHLGRPARSKRGAGRLLLAALLGAIAGSFAMGHRLASACDCPRPSWSLRLAEVPGQEIGWPRDLKLEVRPGTVELWSRHPSAATVDYLQAGAL